MILLYLKNDSAMEPKAAKETDGSKVSSQSNRRAESKLSRSFQSLLMRSVRISKSNNQISGG
jgi:hypothetical protein